MKCCTRFGRGYRLSGSHIKLTYELECVEIPSCVFFLYRNEQPLICFDGLAIDNEYLRSNNYREASTEMLTPKLNEIDYSACHNNPKGKLI